MELFLDVRSQRSLKQSHSLAGTFTHTTSWKLNMSWHISLLLKLALIHMNSSKWKIKGTRSTPIHYECLRLFYKPLHVCSILNCALSLWCLFHFSLNLPLKIQIFYSLFFFAVNSTTLKHILPICILHVAQGTVMDKNAFADSLKLGKYHLELLFSKEQITEEWMK